MTPEMMQAVHRALDDLSTLSVEQVLSLYPRLDGISREEFAREIGVPAAEVLAANRSVGVDVMAGALDQGTPYGISTTAMDEYRLLTENRVVALSGWAGREMDTPDAALRKVASMGMKLMLEGPRRYTETLSVEVDTTPRTFAQPGACAWCRYVAVQGHRYGTYGEEWVETFHENCRCVSIPAAEYIEPDYITEWDAQFDQAGRNIGRGYGKNTWRDYMKEMRRLNGDMH